MLFDGAKMLEQIENSRTNVYLNKAKKEYGMGLSDAFNIFLAQSVATVGMPFKVKLPKKQPNMPNAKTIQTIKKALDGANMLKVDFKTHIKEAQKCITR